MNTHLHSIQIRNVKLTALIRASFAEMDNFSVRTDSNAVGAAGLEEEGSNDDDGEKTARYDEIDDVVKRQTTKMKYVGECWVLDRPTRHVLCPIQVYTQTPSIVS